MSNVYLHLEFCVQKCVSVLFTCQMYPCVCMYTFACQMYFCTYSHAEHVAVYLDIEIITHNKKVQHYWHCSHALHTYKVSGNSTQAS